MKRNKKLIAVFLSLILILTLYFPISSLAVPGTLGSEKPHLYCSFANSEDGGEADGNKLTAGTYDVSFYLSGMEDFALLDIMGTYDTSVMAINSYSELLSDVEGSQFKSPGVFIENGDFDLVLKSTNVDCSAVNSEGQLLVKINVTISTASSVDFADVLTLNTHPQETFIEADFTDYEDYSAPDHDCYALVTEAENYKGTLYPMTADLSPSDGHSVAGSIVVISTTDGDTNGKAAYGEYTISVYSDPDRTKLLTTVKSVCDWSKKENNFVIEGLEDGTYYLTLTSDYALERANVKVVVSGADIADAQIPMVACDVDNTNSVNINDVRTVSSVALMPDQTGYEYCDLDASGSININDVRIVSAFALATFEYDPLVIQ